ncbi:hypothetical protein HRbin26_00112 [bacterium HR26]|nr:hypothetical protein HRbin26_00112 [bacterium HR26]
MGARRAQALACCLLGETLLLRGRWDEAAGYLRRSIELHQALGAKSGEALTWQRLGELAIYRGDATAADKCVQRGLALAAEAPMAAHLMGRLYATAALDALEQGNLAAAARAIGAASAAAERYGDCPTCGALLHPVAAEVYARLGDKDRAEKWAQAAERVAGHWESGAWQAMAEVAHAVVAPSEQAVARFVRAAQLFERLGQPFQAARCLAQAGLIHVERGEREEARGRLERALAIFHEIGAPRAAKRVYQALARLRAGTSSAHEVT